MVFRGKTLWFARLFQTLFIALALCCAGCGEDGDTRVVDFSDTVAARRPSDEPFEGNALRVAIGAMISPKETFDYYRQVLDYVGRRLGRPVRLIQRKTYGEINELFAKGQVDLAFVCSGPYATQQEEYGFELLVTPVVNGSHDYHSYLIVHKDSPIETLEDLRGKVFAFTDPDSNTGKLVPTYWLARLGERPESFFRKTFYTYGHDNSILAVAKGLVDGACVDSLIWEYYHRNKPEVTSGTRVIGKSEPYGIPPLVASTRTSEEFRERARSLLLAMHRDPEGQMLLKELMIDRFETGQVEWYESIRKMEEALKAVEQDPYARAKPED